MRAANGDPTPVKSVVGTNSVYTTPNSAGGASSQKDLLSGRKRGGAGALLDASPAGKFPEQDV